MQRTAESALSFLVPNSVLSLKCSILPAKTPLPSLQNRGSTLQRVQSVQFQEDSVWVCWLGNRVLRYFNFLVPVFIP